MTPAILTKTLHPMIQSMWGHCLQILQYRFQDKELILTACGLIKKTIGSLAETGVQFEFFDNLSTHLITCFNNNQGNISCLQCLSFMCQKMGKLSDEIKANALQKVEAVCQLILQQKDPDVDLLKEFSDLLLRIAELDLAHSFQSNFFS